ncbi:UBAP1-MVB12-associated (UMA)-domain containing protein 1 isoform X2 [Anser cygnoides]|uniref:UBAP1-MVB12-associated (UMA)-domain containing protein 1 isoform X2 n=1 Tax=Anser cygnoides TaxID=8845 RepID=UPI0034D1BF22
MMARMGRRQSGQVALWAAQGSMHSLQKECLQGFSRAASASGLRQMVQVSCLGSSAGSSRRGWLIVLAAARAWGCSSSAGRCSDDERVSSASGPQHLPRRSTAEPQRLAVHQRHLNALCSTRRTSMLCLQPERPQHLTCPQKDLDISSSTSRTGVPHLPPRRTSRLSCHRKDFDVSRSTGRTSTSHLPLATPPRTFQQWDLNLSSVTSRTERRLDAQGIYSQLPFVRSSGDSDSVVTSHGSWGAPDGSTGGDNNLEEEKKRLCSASSEKVKIQRRLQCQREKQMDLLLWVYFKMLMCRVLIVLAAKLERSQCAGAARAAAPQGG